MAKNALGKWGEDLAADFMRRRGYSIVGRNVQISHKEIDLICARDKTLVFVEVKTRVGQGLGDGTEAVMGRKMERFARAAELFLLSCGWEGDFRLDLITVQADRKTMTARIGYYREIL